MTPRLSFSSKQQMLAKPHLMLISPCPWLSASVRITEPVYPTPISREDQGSMSVIACQDLLGKSVKLTLTSASLFHAFEVRRPMSTFSKVLRGMWIFIYSSILHIIAQISVVYSVCSTCHHCIGSIRVLITGMWKCIGFDSFACGFRPQCSPH